MAFVAATSFRVASLSRGAFRGDSVCGAPSGAGAGPATMRMTFSDGVSRRAALVTGATVAAGLVAAVAAPGGPVLVPSVRVCAVHCVGERLPFRFLAGPLLLYSLLLARVFISSDKRHLLALWLWGWCIACAFSSPAQAQAAATVNLGSMVEVYKDLNKGFTILRPQGWNQFEATAGQYDIKWQDLIQPLEIITVLTTPVGKGKTLADIGTPDAVGAKLAKSRRAELVSAVSRDVDGLTYYNVELKNNSVHQLTSLVVNKNKLYSVNVSSAESKWPKREKLLRGVAESFKPSL